MGCVERFIESINGLEDVSQKHALELAVAGWIKAMFGDNLGAALAFSQHLRGQVDAYLRIATSNQASRLHS